MKTNTEFVRGIVITFCIFSTIIARAQVGRMGVTSRGEILFGGPVLNLVKSEIESLVQGQSAGRLRFTKLTSGKTNLIQSSSGAISHLEFEAQVWVSEPCHWWYRGSDEGLIFATFEPSADVSVASSLGSIAISNTPKEYTVSGIARFRASQDGWKFLRFDPASSPVETEQLFRKRCEHNLRRISAMIELYFFDSRSRFPYGVSTNEGGSMELRSTGTDGFDANSFVHFRAMSNLVYFPNELVCPSDVGKIPASTSGALTSTNVSYRFRTELTGDMKEDWFKPMVDCPIHGFVLYPTGRMEIRGKE